MNFISKLLNMNLVTKLLICYFSISATEALVGEEIDDEDYSRLKFCESKLCLDDANQLLKYLYTNLSVDPCLDFGQLVCGKFFNEVRHDDRYLFVGFDRDWRLSALKLIHEALIEPKKENEEKAIKVVKNFYQKCIDEGE